MGTRGNNRWECWWPTCMASLLYAKSHALCALSLCLWDRHYSYFPSKKQRFREAKHYTHKKLKSWWGGMRMGFTQDSRGLAIKNYNIMEIIFPVLYHSRVTEVKQWPIVLDMVQRLLNYKSVSLHLNLLVNETRPWTTPRKRVSWVAKLWNGKEAAWETKGDFISKRINKNKSKERHWFKKNG